MVRALELARLDSNRAYINALARFLPSSARLESELVQLNSNSTLQLDELDRAFRAVQLDVIITINIDDVNKNIHNFVLPTLVFTKFHLGIIYITGKSYFWLQRPRSSAANE